MSNKGKYVLAGLVGAAIGASVVALSTRAFPNLMSVMEAKCKQMMTGMGAIGCGTGNMCQSVSAEADQTTQTACHSEGGSCHGSD